LIVTFHINEHTWNEENDTHLLDFYREHFEDRFLQDTQDFYRSEAEIYLQQHSVMEYLSKVY
jgi:hypothetical protein